VGDRSFRGFTVLTHMHLQQLGWKPAAGDSVIVAFSPSDPGTNVAYAYARADQEMWVPTGWTALPKAYVV
ncbi:MAG TPA: hypothetical protein VGC41_14840, partial [Kofleriaceae bacterium]